MFEASGATALLVRTPEDLAAVDVLAIPGGESTTIAKLARDHGLVDPIRRRASEGMPILGTCAGMIVMSKRIEDGEPLLSLLDVTVRRNAYGRQVDSFEADVEVKGMGSVRAVFIRAPVISELGPAVEVLGEYGGQPVLVRQGKLMAAAFHPEIAGDKRLHERLLAMADEPRDRG